MKKTKIKLFVLSLITFLSVYLSIGINSSQAVTVTCDSATVSGFVAINGNPASVWFEWGPTQYFGNSTINKTYNSNSLHTQLISGLADNTTYYYRLIISNNYNNSKNIGPIQSFKTLKCSIPSVSTNTFVATNITNTSATLNGFINSSGNTVINGWFKWGTDSNLSNQTNKANFGVTNGTSYLYYLNGLTKNTTYYYQAVAEGSNGVATYGEIRNFTTKNDIIIVPKNNPIIPNIKTPVKENTSAAVSQTSSMSLSINHNNETIIKGSVIEYVVNYKNVSSKDVRDVVLRISIPDELKFIEASRGYLSTDGDTITANIDNLASQEEDSLRFRVKAVGSTELGKIIIVTANLAYTKLNTDIQNELFAYTKNIIKDGEIYVVQQGALAFLAGDGFLPNTLIGWLLLILVITLIVLALKKAYHESTTVTSHKIETVHH
jgi:hypothetical protein